MKNFWKSDKYRACYKNCNGMKKYFHQDKNIGIYLKDLMLLLNAMLHFLTTKKEKQWQVSECDEKVKA